MDLEVTEVVDSEVVEDFVVETAVAMVEVEAAGLEVVTRWEEG